MAVKYLEIARDIRSKILTGRWKPRQQLPTREELVTQYGTSKATMQKTINALLTEGLIHTSNKSGTFVTETPPNLYSIAVVFPVKEYEPEYIDSLWSGIMRQHHQLEEIFGRRLIFCRFYNSNVEHEEFQQVIKDAESLRLSGIVFCDKPSPIAAGALEHLNIPKVALTRDEIPSFNRIGFDFSMMFSMGVEYLHKCGRSRLAVITNPEMMPTRTLQCRQLAADYGISMPLEWELSISAWHNPEHWARNIVRLLFKSPQEKRPDGVIVGNENLLEPVVNALRMEGIEPGIDVDIATHTNFPTTRTKPCKLKRIGFDVYDTMKCCIEALEASGPGNFPVPLRLVAPVAENN